MKTCRLNPEDIDLIIQLSEWYFEEWAVPKETTINRLIKQDRGDIIFHLVLKKDEQIIATGGFNAIHR